MQTHIIGIAGGSGSGKSTAVENITNVLGKNQYSLLPHDSYYRDQSHLSLEERVKTNYDHPDSLETELLVEHLNQLQAGHAVERPVYDFSIHNRSPETVTVQPSKIILVEGILLYENLALREMFDLKVFIDTPDDIRFIRRLQRDIAFRGRDMESVIEQYQTTVRPMYIDFVEPSKRYADVIIPEGGKNLPALDLILARILQMAE